MTWARRKKHLDDIFFAPARKHHAHERRRKGGAPLRSVPFMARMLTRNPRLHLQLLVESRTRPRWASSDSSPDPPKPDKKLSDRLSAAIDAVNDRKLPPELRGRSNAVRYIYFSIRFSHYTFMHRKGIRLKRKGFLIAECLFVELPLTCWVCFV